jgi:tetratricopeptide (TPR) repeat protein
VEKRAQPEVEASPSGGDTARASSSASREPAGPLRSDTASPAIPSPRHGLPLLLAAVGAVYALALPAGFLSYDDPWLVVNNPVFDDPSPAALAWIWGKLDFSTRLALGAEYLPVRDTLSWLLVRAFGKSAPAFHVAQLAAYLGAVALIRVWLHRVVAHRPTAELAAWLFALHPAHVSSVAWIAGFKDALSLLFVSAALVVHARRPADAAPLEASRAGGATHASRGARAALVPLLVALLVALACLSKGVAVVAPALLALGDYLAGRRVGWASVLSSGLVAAGSVALQLHVGGVVHMLAEPLPGGALGAIATMAPVAWRYVAISGLLDPPSIVRLVAPRTLADPIALASLAGIASCLALALVAARRGHRLSLAALGLFAAGLAPVSQVLAPLQNRMADRYLLFSLLGPCLLFASAITTRLRPELARLAGGALLLGAALSSALHAAEFAEEPRLWERAIEREPSSPLAPYQLAHLELARGDAPAAERYFRMTIARDGMRTRSSSSATTNLSRLLAASGREAEAIALLREAVARFPAEPRPINNLAILLDARGARAEARALFDRLVREHPDYARGIAAYRERYGELPADVHPTAPAGRYVSDGP